MEILRSLLRSRGDEKTCSEIDAHIRALWLNCHATARAALKDARYLKPKMTVAYCAIVAASFYEGSAPASDRAFASAMGLSYEDLSSWILVRRHLWTRLSEPDRLNKFPFTDILSALAVILEQGAAADVDAIVQETIYLKHRDKARLHLKAIAVMHEFFSQYDIDLLPSDLFRKFLTPLETVGRKFRDFQVEEREEKLRLMGEEMRHGRQANK